jgi:hypothetical protein
VKKTRRAVTMETIDRVRGILKHKSQQKPLAKYWAEHKKAERELEAAKSRCQLTGKGCR